MRPLRPARDIKVASVVARTLRHPDNVRRVAGLAGSALKGFFWLQFSVKLRLRKIPIVNVDHPLDQLVPFTPSRISDYADFISFWIRPLGLIGERFGRRAQRRYTNEFLALVTRCYREAALVYSETMSTTRRPKYRRNGFWIIHLFDPHLLCVPSLHVMLVTLTEVYFRRAFAELGAEPEEVEAVDRELFGGAVAITESVLLIKQHSVNCVPAALYAISRITGGELGEDDVAEFVGALFADSDEVSAEDAEAIRSHISSVYADLQADGAADGEWPPAVRRFLAGFRQKAGAEG